MGESSGILWISSFPFQPTCSQFFSEFIFLVFCEVCLIAYCSWFICINPQVHSSTLSTFQVIAGKCISPLFYMLAFNNSFLQFVAVPVSHTYFLASPGSGFFFSSFLNKATVVTPKFQYLTRGFISDSHVIATSCLQF